MRNKGISWIIIYLMLYIHSGRHPFMVECSENIETTTAKLSSREVSVLEVERDTEEGDVLAFSVMKEERQLQEVKRNVNQTEEKHTSDDDVRSQVARREESACSSDQFQETEKEQNTTKLGCALQGYNNTMFCLRSGVKPYTTSLSRSSKMKEKVRNTETLTTADAASLGRMLATIAEQELKECELVVAYDDGYDHPEVMDRLLMLPSPRQMLHVRKLEDLLSVVWSSSGCQGYMFLLHQPQVLITFTHTHLHSWDYHARYLLVAPSRKHLESFAASEKGKKTEHIIGATKFAGQGVWGLYMNQLYLGEGMRRIGSWRQDRFTSQLQLFPEKLSDLRGVVLKVVTFEWEPSVFYYKARNGSVLFLYGTDIGVVNTLASVLNFTVQYEEPPHGERWGREEENGTWSGMMGKLARNEVDIGVVDLYVTIVRVGILDYSAPYDSELSCFMARTEPPLPRWQAIAFPFQAHTWLAILVGFVISGPMLYLVARASSHCGQEVSSLQSLSSSWYYAVGLHCCEAQVTLPRMRSTRVFIIFLWLYTITLTIAYSTNLTAFLLVAKTPETMETIQELHASGLEVSGVGKFYGDALGSASDPYLQSLKDKFQDYSDAKFIFPRVQDGKAVMIQNSPFLEFVAATRFTSRGVSSMRLMKECFAPFNIAMALQRHSPLKRKFDQVIGWMVNGGLIRQYFLRSLRLFDQNSKELADEEAVRGDEGVTEMTSGGVIPLSLDHVQGIFFINILGWLVSFCVFLTEIIL